MSGNKKHHFQYGRCYTDHKAGMGSTRFLGQSDEQDRFIRQALEGYGLPYPDLSTQVHRGFNEDLLFLDSHGIVIRIGRTDIAELINPAIVQPLHSTQDPESCLTVSLYPGVQLFSAVSNDIPEGLSLLKEALRYFGNEEGDVKNSNAGVVEVIADKENLVKVPIQLDADPNFNGRLTDRTALDISSLTSNSTALWTEQRANIEIEELYQQAWHYHAPLRRVFSRAVQKNRMDLAWAMVDCYHQDGYKIFKQDKRTPHQNRYLYSPWQLDKALQVNGLLLQNFPEEERNPERCLQAVTQNGWTLRYVPEAHRSPEICLAAVTQNGLALEDVPEANRSPEICLAAVTQNWRALRSVPDANRSPEIYLAAVTQNWRALEYVPEELRTKEICRATGFIIDKQGGFLDFSEEKFDSLCIKPQTQRPSFSSLKPMILYNAPTRLY